MDRLHLINFIPKANQNSIAQIIIAQRVFSSIDLWHFETKILTQSWQFEGIRRVDHIHVGLQLESAGWDVQIVIEHRVLEGRLHLVGSLLEDGTCSKKTK